MIYIYIYKHIHTIMFFWGYHLLRIPLVEPGWVS